MPTLSKVLADQYDPSVLTFHNQASNLPHLSSWIDELIILTRKGSHSKTQASTENLVESIQRYNSVFIELLYQTNIFSENITKLLAKTWNGSMLLMETMIKTYHKYVRANAQTQIFSSNLLREKQKEDASIKNKEEDYILDRTVLRARIRALESELEGLKMMLNSSNNEVKYLRMIVDEFIRSNTSTSVQNNINKNHKNSNSTNNSHNNNTNNSNSNNNNLNNSNNLNNNQKNIPGGAKNVPHQAPLPGFGNRNHRELGRYNLRNLSMIENEMGNVLSLISKEEDRQRLIIEDIEILIEKNNEIFILEDSSIHEKNVLLVRKECSTQVDEKDSFGAINRPEECSSSKESSRNSGKLNSSDKEYSSGKEHSFEEFELDDNAMPPPNILIIEKNIPLLHSDGKNVPYNLRILMTHFPVIIRIPPLEWLNQTIMSIYVSKIISDDKLESKGKEKLSLSENIYFYFLDLYGLAAVVDVQVRTYVRTIKYEKEIIVLFLRFFVCSFYFYLFLLL